MQYAKIVPETKTSLKKQLFSYEIPPEHLSKIKKGSLVLIPFGKRKIKGIIVDISKKIPRQLQGEVKPIAGVVSSTPVIDENQLKLAYWLSQHYLCPLSQSLFEMVPPFVKRISQVKSEPLSPPDSFYPRLGQHLLMLCQKAIKKKKQAIVLFPEVKIAQDFFSFISKKIPKTAIYHHKLSKTKRYQTWQKIRQGEIEVVCGSRLALFAPLNKLGLIIIVGEESEAYKNEQSPRYHTKNVALYLSKIHRASLVLESPTPSVESYFHSQKGLFYLIKEKIPQPPYIHLIDMENEIKKGNSSPFGKPLQTALQRVYRQKGKIILFLNRRGTASYIFCRECGYTLKCPNCDVPLTYHLTGDKNQSLVCHHCLFTTKPLFSCPSCGGFNFRFWGLGTQKVETEIKKLLPKARVLRIDKDFKENEQDKPYQVIIGTQKLLSSWQEPARLVGIISIDQLLNLPDLNTSQKVFATILRLKALSKEYFFLQTFHPENFTIDAAIKNDWQRFYQNEIENRKRLNLPPFSRIIQIVYQHKNIDKCQEATKILSQKLNEIINQERLPFWVIGPSACFYAKIRGKYRYQIILKTKPNRILPPKIYHLLASLSENWTINPEPATIL